MITPDWSALDIQVPTLKEMEDAATFMLNSSGVHQAALQQVIDTANAAVAAAVSSLTATRELSQGSPKRHQFWRRRR